MGCSISGVSEETRRQFTSRVDSGLGGKGVEKERERETENTVQHIYIYSFVVVGESVLLLFRSDRHRSGWGVGKLSQAELSRTELVVMSGLSVCVSCLIRYYYNKHSIKKKAIEIAMRLSFLKKHKSEDEEREGEVGLSWPLTAGNACFTTIVQL